MITYDLDKIPFSMPGSFLIITSRTPGNTENKFHRLIYRTCSSRTNNQKYGLYTSQDFFEIALVQGGIETPYTWMAQPHRVDLTVENSGKAVFVFTDPQTIVFGTEGVNLRLIPCKPYATKYSINPSELVIDDWAARGFHHLRSPNNKLVKITRSNIVPGGLNESNDESWAIDFTGSKGGIRFERNENFWHGKFPRLATALQEKEKEYSRWRKHIPVVPEQYEAAAEKAWLLLWVCQVPMEGAITRPAIYMSKFWMNAIWAWDNCFNALAIAEAYPKFAWDQLLLFYDHQDPNGMIPDMINDQGAIFNFTKPPIYGWTIRKLVAKMGVKAARPYLEQLYKPVNRLTEWWYTMRDFDGDGMCQYHHGNDSGWDNATLFDQGYPTEGADLAAHLVLQSEGLSFMARAIGKKVASLRWKKRGEHQLADLLSQGIKNGKFFSPLDGTNEAPETQSLLNYIPMVLGRRLPKKLRKSMIADLGPGGPFLTDWGLATESPKSPKYEPNGYWRGPIWAPSTYLIIDGLITAGEMDLAILLAKRFCDLCAQDSGFWENYDALTGKGLSCPGYTWTASVFLLLASWLKDNKIE